MADGDISRRLAAIVVADVAGYSRLVEQDEDATLAALRSLRARLIDPKIAAHKGRIANTAGDSILVEFHSVVEALNCAQEIQAAVQLRNRDIDPERRIEFRFGINVGDVVEQDGDLLGEGVNIAARLEAMADPGDIYISRTARDQVLDRTDIALEDLGPVKVKNMARPVHAYRVLTIADAASAVPRKRPVRRRLKGLTAAFVALLVLAAVAVYVWMEDRRPEASYPVSSVSAEATIAVLPFTNLSGDPEQEYFSDGITNDLITDLSKFSNLFVIASNSVFTYKGKAVKVQDAGRDLGVRYIVEGSVQKLGGRVRINAQLVDAASGRHLWADRYEEAADDLFDLQTRITRHIVRTLAVKLTDFEIDRAFAKPNRDLQAYDLALRGWHLVTRLKREENFQARQFFRDAIARDPTYAAAHAGLGLTFHSAVRYGWTGAPQAAMQRAHELVQQALSLDNSSVIAHRLAAGIYLTRRQYDLALLEIERALALNPNDARSLATQGAVMLFAGHPEGAVISLETALRYDPLMGAGSAGSLATLGLAYYLTRRYGDAARILERGLAKHPGYLYGQTVLAAAYGQLGNLNQAGQAARVVRQLNPVFDISEAGGLLREPADRAHFTEGLRKAGLE